MKQYEVLKWASLFLQKHQCESRVAEILLQHHLHISRSEFYANMHEPVSPAAIKLFETDIQAHVETGVPVQHLLGYEYFYGRKFIVNEDVLIPRPETEDLVEHCIKEAEQHFYEEPLTIVDVGTGSGIIAISLALEMPNAVVFATDISNKALTIAKQNAEILRANVQFSRGNFLQPLINKNNQAQMIISNPPYIAKSEQATLSQTVKKFDPTLALFAEEQGLAAYQDILNQAPKVVTSNSLLAFEIGHEQGKAVRSLIKTTFPTSKIRIIQDINKKDRIVSAQL